MLNPLATAIFARNSFFLAMRRKRCGLPPIPQYNGRSIMLRLIQQSRSESPDAGAPKNLALGAQEEI